MSRSVLIAVTHLLGVGHLARAAALGRGLAAAGHRVTLVSGGRPAPLVARAGLNFVQLPPVHCRGVDFTTLLDDGGIPIGDAYRTARIEALCGALEEAAPDVVITETFPFGRRSLAAEFLALIEAAEARAQPPILLASLRDILNPPSRPERAAEAEVRLGRHYDGALVHGDAAFTPLSASWPVSPALARRLDYTGYIGDPAPSPRGVAADGGEVLVSGGGSAASLPLFEAALGAAALSPGGRRWRLLIGHGVAGDTFDALAASAGPGVVVERARPDFPALLAGAAVSVSQAGYNTVIDLAIAGTRAVLVPFERGNEAEQRLRAACFADRGAAILLPEAELGAETLAAAVATALEAPAGGMPALDLAGVAGSVRAIERAADRRDARRAAWTRLDRALGRLAPGALEFWWRDDDAIEPTPALDRLLELARRFGLPPALAVVPAPATPALAIRLADEPGIVALVHGVAHTDHAPPGARKQELGYRPAAVMEGELACALDRVRSLFGARAGAVLVPPWNRIDDSVLPRLPALGFTAMSAFGPRPRAAPAELAVVNTHLDPIGWRTGGGLAEEAVLIDAFAGVIERWIERDPAERRPIGLLTHHLVHDAWVWRFLERLLGWLADRPAVRFTAPSEIFAVGTERNTIASKMG